MSVTRGLSCLVQGLPLRGLGHVPGNVAHLLALWQELVEVLNAFSILDEELRLAWHSLLALDKVEDEDRRAVAAKEVIEVPCCGRVVWIFDCD